VTTWRAQVAEIEQQLATASGLDDESRRDARREARLLVSSVLDWTPGELSQRLDDAVSPDGEAKVHAAAARRARGEPMAYAVGTAAFRQLVLRVDARVLIPRPETETVVETVLELSMAHPGGTAVDIGTGSGSIALSLATEGQFARILATDISSDALEVARANAARLNPPVPVEFRQGVDLSPLDELARVIVSNPPYIAYEEASELPASVRDWEPATALFAPDGGMARYAVLLAGAARWLEPDGFIVFEVDARRAGDTARRAIANGWRDVQLRRDLSGRERVLIARRPST
jgi:release factor glutamine methyltransferase